MTIKEFAEKNVGKWVKTAKVTGRVVGYDSTNMGGTSILLLATDLDLKDQTCNCFFKRVVILLPWEGYQSIEWVNKDGIVAIKETDEMPKIEPGMIVGIEWNGVKETYVALNDDYLANLGGRIYISMHKLRYSGKIITKISRVKWATCLNNIDGSLEVIWERKETNPKIAQIAKLKETVEKALEQIKELEDN